MRRRAFIAGAALVFYVPKIDGAGRVNTRRSMLMLRVLGRDRHLRRRAGKKLHIAVVFLDDDESSKAEARGVLSSLKSAARTTEVQGLDIVPHAFAFDDKLEKKLQGSGACAVFVCAGLEQETERLSELAGREKCLSFSSDAWVVHKGLSVGLFPAGSKTRLLINLAQSRREGANLPSALLRLAEVIK